MRWRPLFSPFAQISPADFQRATAVTYQGVVGGTMAALRRMKPRNAGVIVQVGFASLFRTCASSWSISSSGNSLAAFGFLGVFCYLRFSASYEAQFLISSRVILTTILLW